MTLPHTSITSMMDFIFTATLTAVQSEQVLRIYNGTKVISIEQYPGFAVAADPDLSVRYLLAYRDGVLCGYACVTIKKIIMASVLFGPIVADPADYMEVCAGLKRKCLLSGVLVIRITPPYMAEMGDLIISPQPGLRFRHSDGEINWATQKLSLDRPIADIFANFSQHHRRNIQKAQRLDLKTEIISGPGDINIFSEQYLQMYSGKGMHLPSETTRKAFRNLFDFFKQNNNGYFLAVKSQDEAIIGGICICYQGDSAFYYKGYSHSAYRQLPIGHLAMYQAIIYAKEENKQYFDLGGYGINIDQDHPVYSINKFKDGYRGELVIHPKTMLVHTVPLAGWLYSLNKKGFF